MTVNFLYTTVLGEFKHILESACQPLGENKVPNLLYCCREARTKRDFIDDVKIESLSDLDFRFEWPIPDRSLSLLLNSSVRRWNRFCFNIFFETESAGIPCQRCFLECWRSDTFKNKPRLIRSITKSSQFFFKTNCGLMNHVDRSNTFKRLTGFFGCTVRFYIQVLNQRQQKDRLWKER